MAQIQHPVVDAERNPTSNKMEPEHGAIGDTLSDAQYLHGMRLATLNIGLCLSIALVNLEISIVSTSLVSITNDLQGFGRSNWIIVAYLLTYTSFMVILAKLSDSIGRKSVLMASLLLFIIFSGACGAAQTLNQLIVFRVFQGLGGSGVYALVIVVLYEIAPAAEFARYTVLVTSLFALALLSGPLIGGAINNNTTWRWVFLLNVPAGVFSLILLFFWMPNNLPRTSQGKHKFSFRKLDLVGAGAMLVGVTLLIVGFEEASDFAPWTSARVLAPLLVSLVAWLAFVWNERRVTLRKSGLPEPVFPWRFCVSRVVMGIYITAFLSGAVFTTCIIAIPLRFQTVNGTSPWLAGVRLIPFGVATPVGAAISAAICAKRRVPVVYLLFPAAIFQVLGLVFMSRMALDDIRWTGQYGLQFLTGFGCGVSIGVVTLMVPYAIEKRDLATATSAAVQVRVIGGALILALTTGVMNNNLEQSLVRIISIEDLGRIVRAVSTIQSLEEPLQTAVKDVFLNEYNTQLRILIGVAAAGVPVALMMWQREQVRVD
ncbi:hypothetical protein NX059_001292 [Plenodomus lindquistii]|nr:hypothetical protein NX059_001292 [Plenodomus lindquistii]